MTDGIVDFHSHILPRFDDGADSVQESVAILESLHCQGVGTVCATSHYLAINESVEEYVRRRERAYSHLCESAQERDLPRILLGAEIRVSYGISERDLAPLAFEETKALLFEMPFSELSHQPVNELRKISNRGYTVVIAHIDRYKWYRSDDIDLLCELPEVIFQINVSALRSVSARRLALKLIKRGCHVIFGSDTHNTSDRPAEMFILTDEGGKSPLSRSRRETFLSAHESGTHRLLGTDGTGTGYGLVF